MALIEAADVPEEEGKDFAVYKAEAGTNIHRGAALGWNAGFVRPFVDGDVKAGIAMESRDSTALSAGEELDISVLVSGAVELDVAGVVDDTDVLATVYVTDDATYSLTDTGTDEVFGIVKKAVAAGRAIVKFDAVPAP